MTNPQTPPGTIGSAPPISCPSLADPTLFLLAAVLDDLERTRLANESRLRQLTLTGADKDGIERGFGLDERHPDVGRLAGLVAAIAQLEHDAILNLRRRVRAHPLGPWINAQVGVGEKQAARLLAATGDPYWNGLHDRPRTVSELWAYCGLHVCDPGQVEGVNQANPAGVAARRRRGQSSNWSGNAKMRAYLIAASCVKQRRSPFRTDYDSRRAWTAVTHPEWTPGHSHNDAIRITAKAILREMWREARHIHGITDEEVETAA